MEKLISPKITLKMTGGGMHSPSSLVITYNSKTQRKLKPSVKYDLLP